MSGYKNYMLKKEILYERDKGYLLIPKDNSKPKLQILFHPLNRTEKNGF